MSADCFYCTKDQKLNDLMIEIGQMEVSTLYLFREQTYRGRCIVAYNGHVKELFELPEKELERFMRDVTKAARAIQEVFSPDKINSAICSAIASLNLASRICSIFLPPFPQTQYVSIIRDKKYLRNKKDDMISHIAPYHPLQNFRNQLM